MYILLIVLLCIYSYFPSCQGEELSLQEPLHIYSATSKLEPVKKLIDKTTASIARYVAPRSGEYHNVPIHQLLQIAEAGKADILIAGAGFTSRRNSFAYRDIGSAITKEQRDINHANGSTVIVLKDRDELKTLADLKGKTFSKRP